MSPKDDDLKSTSNRQICSYILPNLDTVINSTQNPDTQSGTLNLSRFRKNWDVVVAN